MGMESVKVPLIVQSYGMALEGGFFIKKHVTGVKMLLFVPRKA